MLPKPQRLTKNFAIIFQKGAKITTPFFVLRGIPAWDDASRLAIIVSGKTEKSAVKRNRIRRRLIAAAETAGFPSFPQQRFRIVLIGKTDVLEADYLKLVATIKEAFAKLDAWRFPPRPESKIQRL